jgi:hypothetical protein
MRKLEAERSQRDDVEAKRARLAIARLTIWIAKTFRL